MSWRRRTGAHGTSARSSTSSHPPTSDPPTTSATRPLRFRRTLGVGGVIVAVIAAWLLWPEPRPAGFESIAVLPFADTLTVARQCTGVVVCDATETCVIDPDPVVTHEMAVATAPIDSPIGVIEPTDYYQFSTKLEEGDVVLIHTGHGQLWMVDNDEYSRGGPGIGMAAARWLAEQKIVMTAADTSAGSCRLTYVAANMSDTALDRTAYEVAIFDAEGVVTRLLVLEFGALIEGKTKILQFDLAETDCASISRIVINDVAGCTRASDGQESDLCLNGLTASSRTDIDFGL